MRGFSPRSVPSRLVFLILALSVLCLVGLWLLLFRWSGKPGAPPAGRLYVLGDFPGDRPLVRLVRTADPRDPQRTCYGFELPGSGTVMVPPASDPDADPPRLCRGKPAKVEVEGVVLTFAIGPRGAPQVSIAGGRLAPGDWIGSLADPRRADRPRFPLRGYGIPGLAARVVDCAELPGSGPESPSAALCIETRDDLGRLAVARPPEAPPVADHPLRSGGRYRLVDGDELWLGLVPFAVRVEEGALPLLERSGRSRAATAAGEPGRVAGHGGDRRWLGRLWHIEVPEPAAALAATPERFEVYPMEVRYTPHHLSRQRTNFEGEDVLQSLIDGEWLCLDTDPETGGAEIGWRPLQQPGCGPSLAPRSTQPATSVRDYQRARFGELSFSTRALIAATGGALEQGRHLEDPTALPLTFDWRLRQPVDRGAGIPEPQPVPAKLWGVRFGATRQLRPAAGGGARLLPGLVPRSSTARHLLQVEGDGDLVASFYLARGEDGEEAGSICLGAPGEGDWRPYRTASGDHHPLGSVAFDHDLRGGHWSPQARAGCNGCRISLTAGPQSAGDALAIERTGDCGALDGGEAGLAAGEALRWQRRGETLELRRVARGDPPWLALTDSGTGRRHLAGEFLRRGGLEPLLGDVAGLSGVEAAVRAFAAGGAPSGPVELSIDGDLQIAAASIVDAQAREAIQVRGEEEQKVKVSAVILDADDGAVLAAVNWSVAGSRALRSGEERRPTAWELGSGQAGVAENAAFLRRSAVGSTMKVVGAYALINNGLSDGAEVGPESGAPRFQEVGVSGGGRLYLHRGEGGRRPRQPVERQCSTGGHFLPASSRGFTTATFVRRFAVSCNGFFILTGLRHASAAPAAISPLGGAPAADGLGIDRRSDQPTIVLPAYDDQPLVERIRGGLAADFAAGDPVLPRSVYGILARLGFQLRAETRPTVGVVPASIAFEHAGQQHQLPLVDSWFAPRGESSGGGTSAGGSPATRAPVLRPGRDFSYPGLPSPGRLDESTFRNRGGAPAIELFDGEPFATRRLAADGDWAEVQYAMLLIGQSSVELSALGLATVFAPAARDDGRSVRPCLFRANCGDRRQGERVLDVDAAAPLNEALRQVMLPTGTAFNRLQQTKLRSLPERGWGGKTGTYQVEEARWPEWLIPEMDWRRLVAHACGVGGVEPPTLRSSAGTGSGGKKILETLSRLVRAEAGSALGARTCEHPRWPLNPAGIQGYRDGPGPADLDAAAADLAALRTPRLRTYHTFVALAPPPRGGWPQIANPAQGVVVAVLVDHDTPSNREISVATAAELAAMVERWATLGNRRTPPLAGG